MSWVRIVLGAALVVLGARQWRSRHEEQPAPAWMQSLESATPRSAARLSVLLSLANPKILLFSAAAGMTIGAAETTGTESVVAVVVFALAASVTVALPVLAHVVLGDRATAPLRRANDWLTENNTTIMAVVLLDHRRPGARQGSQRPLSRAASGSVRRGQPEAAVAGVMRHDRLRGRWVVRRKADDGRGPGGATAVVDRVSCVLCRSEVIGLGLPAALLVTVKLVVTDPTAVGLNVTDRLQDLPAASAVGQLPRVTENGADVDSPAADRLMTPGPLLVSLTFCVVFVLSRRVPKATVAGVTSVGAVTTGAGPCPSA